MKIDERWTRVFCCLVFPAFFTACVTASKPNIPFSDAFPELDYIEAKNPLLSLEIRKIPEILDGVNAEERGAIQRLARLYRLQEPEFDASFGAMYQTGIPEVRKYCAPLQALFWIAMQRPFSKEDNPVHPYTLHGLLDEAWTFRPMVSPAMIRRIVGAIKDPEIRTNYEAKMASGNRYALSSLLSHVKYSPESFEDWVPSTLKAIQGRSSWNDYDAVADRLNSPELVDYYVKRQIGYSNYWDILGYDHKNGDPRYVFKHKAGDCLYISTFIAQTLRKNGYKAWVEKKPSVRASDAWHAICVFAIQGDKYVIDDGRYSKRGIVRYEDY